MSLYWLSPYQYTFFPFALAQMPLALLGQWYSYLFNITSSLVSFPWMILQLVFLRMLLDIIFIGIITWLKR